MKLSFPGRAELHLYHVSLSNAVAERALQLTLSRVVMNGRVTISSKTDAQEQVASVPVETLCMHLGSPSADCQTGLMLSFPDRNRLPVIAWRCCYSR